MAPGLPVDLDELNQRVGNLVDQEMPGSRVVEMTRIPTGMSSFTFAFDLEHAGERSKIVVKMAPPGLAPVRNRDVLRQARVMKALSDSSGVAVPVVVFEDAGQPPEIPPLFATQFVAGECFEPLSDAGEPPRPDVVNQRMRNTTVMLARLHTVDVGSVGLAEESIVTLDEEVQRWIRLFDTMPTDLRKGSDVCAEALLNQVPKPLPSTIVHGDYRLGNIICEGPRPRAIVDWEIWSRADPRMDLAWFLLNSNPEKPNAIRDNVGMPPLDEVQAEYESTTYSPVADFHWFHALVRFKQASATAAVVKHDRQRRDRDPQRAQLARSIEPLLQAARRFLDDPEAATL